jgi:DNA polymerase V
MKKVIALVDCNNFFVSCERVFNPAAFRKPTVVLSSNDGCVISRSQEVKDMGIIMGMPYFKMKKLFDMRDVRVFSSNFRLYHDMSQRVMGILQEYVSDMEIYSIDEAFLDISSQEKPEEFCTSLVKKIYQYTGIPVSIGIAPTKTLAKVANVMGKQQQLGTYVILDDDTRTAILKDLSVGKVWGIGRKMADKLHANGIYTAEEFIGLPNQWIQKTFGIVGLRLAHELRGVACLKTETSVSARKSIISSRSFGNNITNFETLLDSVYSHVRSAARQMRDEKNTAQYMSVSIYTNRHAMVPQYNTSRQVYFDIPVSDTFTLMKAAKDALRSMYKTGFEYAKSGISLGSFVPSGIQQATLFEKPRDGKEENILMKTIDTLHDRFGSEIISVGAQQKEKPWLARNNFISPNYTTSWRDIVTIS